MDEILDLPLPDPRVGERFRLGGGLDDLTGGEGGGEGEEGDGDDIDDADVDYDQLIALGKRINVARYIERAFERAREGLEGTPDPELEAEAEDGQTGMASGGQGAGAQPQPQPLQPQAAAAASSSGPSGASTPTSAWADNGGGSSSGSYVDDIDTKPDAAALTGVPPSASGIDVDPEAEDEFSVPSHAPAAPSPSAPAPIPTPTASPAPDSADAAADSAPADASSPGADGALPGSPRLSPEDEAAARRRVELLVELLGASGAELEAKLEAVAPDVDEPMLKLLEARYNTALRLRQDAATTERIATLHRALKYIYQRRNSTAAERLLDDVLEILGDAAAQPDPVRRRGEAAARLRTAFTGGMLELDVFTAAEALAGARQAAAEAMASEQVSVEAFKAEAMGLLDHATRVQNGTAAALEQVEAEVARLREKDPAALEGPEWRARMARVGLARTALAERQGSIAALEEVLLITRAIEVQMMTGRMGSG